MRSNREHIQVAMAWGRSIYSVIFRRIDGFCFLFVAGGVILLFVMGGVYEGRCVSGHVRVGIYISRYRK